jgi:hypothetical protein
LYSENQDTLRYYYLVEGLSYTTVVREVLLMS